MVEVAAAVALVLGIALGLLLARQAYASDLRRIARFLRGRDWSSNARVLLNTRARGLPDLVNAVNDELDASADVRIASERHAAEFRRGLSALSHDIRTPLMGAKGYLQLAAEEPDARRRSQLLDSATERLCATEGLLDQLFDYAKATDPDFALAMAPVALRTLVVDVLVGHYPEFEARGWEPVVRFAREDVLVEADEEQLRRIIENLVTNALRYGAGAPQFEERCLEGEGNTGHLGEKRVVLALSNPVSDPGALDATRLFERFYQADPSRGGRGAGLGLSVAARLAEAMGMRIDASIEADTLTISLEMPSGR